MFPVNLDNFEKHAINLYNIQLVLKLHIFKVNDKTLKFVHLKFLYFQIE